MNKEIDSKDIKEYLETQSDFDLELFVYQSVKAQAMLVEHGGSYFDSLTGKNRQFDIRAYLLLNNHCGIYLAIECKSLSKTFPLIVSRVPRPEEDAYHELIKTWGRIENAEDFQKAIQSKPNMPKLYPAGFPVGKKTVQIRRDISKKGSFAASDGETFDKWSQALASAADLIKNTRKLRGKNGSGDFHTAILPILVVSDETLWAVDYSEDGRSEPKLIEEAEVFVDRDYNLINASETFRITHLHIFTRSGFTKFLAALRSDGAFGLQQKIFGLTYS